jgi:hypothetical protein
MNLILLNSIQSPSTFLNKKFGKNINFDKIKTKLKTAEQRKMDNLKQSFSFVKEMGQKDIDHMKQLHSTIVEEFKKEKNNENNTSVIPTIAFSGSFDEEEDIFDN